MSELAWIRALAGDTDIHVASPLPGIGGDELMQATEMREGLPQYIAMFAHVPGAHPSEEADLTEGFRRLGNIAADLHDHAERWARPGWFDRFSWDEAAILGSRPIWGRWQDAPNMSEDMRATIARAETILLRRLRAFGRSSARFGLIHADMRLANLIESDAGTTVIDFDDCGFGWYLYDLAAALSFMETDPRVPELISAWTEGYCATRDLPAEDRSEIESFVLLRRLALLAWIGSHIEAPEPQAMAPHFAAGTAELAELYLGRFG